MFTPNMFTTITKPIVTTVTATIAATPTHIAPFAMTTNTTTTGRYPGDWQIALIVVLGTLGLGLLGVLVAWLNRKWKVKYVSSISGAKC